MMKIKLKILFFLPVLLIVTRVHAGMYEPPKPMPADTLAIPMPGEVKIDYFHDGYNQTITMRFEQLFDFAGHIRSLTGHIRQSMNINAFDGVDNSSWFTNRNAMEKMSVESFAKGPDQGNGPDQSGKWVITRAKTEGITPGFTIKDARGDRYVIKFDPPGYSELATGAEVVVTKLFYGMGYFVPENYLVIFNPDILQLGENVTLVDEKGRKRNMTESDVANILTRIEFLPDGRIRALASKYVEGKPLGGFRYEGTRKDDPNDIIPHNFRREMRGLEVACSWLKHFDTKAGNNLDSYIGEPGKGYIRHYLIDFGSTLGSAAFAPQDPYKGHEYDLDFQVMAMNVITLGMVVKKWERLPACEKPAIGIFDSWDFDPSNTRPIYPNPAFVSCTNLDGYWGAKLVNSIADDQLWAAVKTGGYTNPEDEKYIYNILKDRRDKVGLYWYTRVCPLDFFEINNDKNLSFKDMGVTDGLWTQDESGYRYSIKVNDKVIAHNKETSQTLVPLQDYWDQVVTALQKQGNAENQLHITLQNRNSHRKFDKKLIVHTSCSANGENIQLLGIEREN